MKRAIEYRTTWVNIEDLDYRDPSAHMVLVPSPPDGPGWQMCGSAANTTRLFWFWQRPA